MQITHLPLFTLILYFFDIQMYIDTSYKIISNCLVIITNSFYTTKTQLKLCITITHLCIAGSAKPQAKVKRLKERITAQDLARFYYIEF